MTGFGVFLAAAREKAGLQQAELSEVIGKSRTYVSGMEKGRIRPPPKTDCDALDRALALEIGTLWSYARPERLQALDPDLYAWHREQVAAAAGSLTPSELRLIERVRAGGPEVANERARLAGNLLGLGSVFEDEPLTEHEVHLIGVLRHADGRWRGENHATTLAGSLRLAGLLADIVQRESGNNVQNLMMLRALAARGERGAPFLGDNGRVPRHEAFRQAVLAWFLTASDGLQAAGQVALALAGVPPTNAAHRVKLALDALSDRGADDEV